MATSEGLRSEALSLALKEAAGGSPVRLYKQLGLVSGLPGTRMNVPVAVAFANECATHGKAGQRLARTMATLDADEAPGATQLEFLPVCGVLALGVCAAAEPTLRKDALAILHDAAEDPRFRVREAVILALARLGEKMGDALVHEVATWTNGYFQAAAALSGMASAPWISAIDDVEAVTARLGEAFELARDAPRSAARWPGRKQLVEVLAAAPAALAARFGVPIFDQLVAWSNVELPELREAIAANLKKGPLASRYATEILRVEAALETSKPKPRDPTIIVHGTRRRGGGKRR